MEPHLFSKLWFRMLQISDEAVYVSEAQSDLDRHNAVNVCTSFHDVTKKYLRVKGCLLNQCYQLWSSFLRTNCIKLIIFKVANTALCTKLLQFSSITFMLTMLHQKQYFKFLLNHKLHSLT